MIPNFCKFVVYILRVIFNCKLILMFFYCIYVKGLCLSIVLKNSQKEVELKICDGILIVFFELFNFVYVKYIKLHFIWFVSTLFVFMLRRYSGYTIGWMYSYAKWEVVLYLNNWRMIDMTCVCFCSQVNTAIQARLTAEKITKKKEENDTKSSSEDTVKPV